MSDVLEAEVIRHHDSVCFTETAWQLRNYPDSLNLTGNMVSELGRGPHTVYSVSGGTVVIQIEGCSPECYPEFPANMLQLCK